MQCTLLPQCISLPHITASVFINDDERGLHQDYDDWLEGLAPHAPIDRYRHNRTGEACPEQPALSVAEGESKGQP